MCAFLNNIIEIRSDAFKICRIRRRPQAVRASSIGEWIQMLRFLCVLSVMTNCALMCLTSTQIEALFPGTAGSVALKITCTFALEHFLLSLVMALASFIPSKPACVKVKVARDEVVFQKLIKKAHQGGIKSDKERLLNDSDCFDDDESEENENSPLLLTSPQAADNRYRI